MSAQNTPANDPHPDWLAAWRLAEQEWSNLPDESPEQKAAWLEDERLSMLLCKTKATTAAGLAAQFAWLKEDLGHHFTDMVSEDYADALETIASGFEAITSTTAPKGQTNDR